MYNKANEKYKKTNMVDFMKLSDINPHIRYARIHHTLNTRNEYSVCYDCRLFFINNGNGIIDIQGEKQGFSDNTVIYLPPGTKYKFSKNNENAISIIVFDFDPSWEYSHLADSLGTVTESEFDKSRVMTYELPCEFSEPFVMSCPDIYGHLTQAVQEFLECTLYYREMAGVLLKMSLTRILREKHACTGTESKTVSAVMEYIHKNYDDAELSNEDIAHKFGYHPYYLGNIVSRAAGMSLRQYLTRYRLKMAQNFLITTELDINVIAWRCGFNSTAYFIRLFREFFGITPGAYRKSVSRGAI
ncbi:MAG: helix-turn-helix transcriptional regulator [Ruminococcaceae bacterium]|nr:helix-turn-helix transcriptional regulator [Oscillospiraceae bacterium]